MPRRPILPADTTLDVSFPYNGVDTSNAFSKQAPATTPAALNVRSFEPGTDRQRGGVRSGLTRYCPDRLNGLNVSIQSLDVITSQYPLEATAGQQIAYSQTASSKSFGLALGATGGSYATGGAANETFQVSCWGESNDLYVAVFYDDMETSGVKVRKVSSAGTVAWTATIADATACGGIATDGTHVFVGVTFTSPTSAVYRLTVAAGTNPDTPDPWVDTGGVLLANFSNDETTAATQRQNQLAYAAGSLGCALIDAGTGYVFQAIATADGTSLGNYAVADTSASMQSAMDVATDGAAFFYAVMGGGSDDGRVLKLTVLATLVWAQTPRAGSGQGVVSVAYDAVGKVLAVCGGTGALTGAGNVALMLPGDGAVVATANVGSGAVWSTVRAAGDGGFVLWLVGASNNFAKVSADLDAVWGPLTRGGAAHVGGSVNTAGGAAAVNLGGRQLRLLGTAGGTIVRFDRTEVTSVTGGAGALAPLEYVVFARQNGPKLWYVDGWQYKVYDAATDAVTDWTASAGSLPTDSSFRSARLIDTWRGRTVLSGLAGDPQNWFMSAVDDPRDWDYSPTTPNAGQAVAGNNAPAGLVGDIVNSLCPYDDDRLFFGGDHTLWMMTGDPADGGRLDRVSDQVGMTWGRPWTKGPDGTVYFFATRGLCYGMVPGQRPQVLSQQITEALRKVNVATYIVRMAWNDRQQGCHLFLTPLDKNAEALHYFWEYRTNAWWPDRFASKDFNPKCVLEYDGDDPNDRVVLIGSWDGLVRFLDYTSVLDDGMPIDFSVVLGPWLTRGLADLMVKESQVTFSTDSGPVSWEWLVGESAEAALSSTAVASGTWAGGRNFTEPVRRAAYAQYLKLSGSGVGMSLENLRLLVANTGKVRGRGA